jgi:hypothetical protein
MQQRLLVLALLVTAVPVEAQVAGKFPPDSLINTKVIAHGTPVMDVVGTMRTFAQSLGVRCQFCHLGEEGKPLETFDFASDEKRTKRIAREMMRMTIDANHRLDTLAGRTKPNVEITCRTCHRGISRPIPLPQLVQETVEAAGADSAIRAYRALRARYLGRDSYDFGEGSLTTAAQRLARGRRYADALQVLAVNEEFVPQSSAIATARGNILVQQGDTAGAKAAFRVALTRDSTNTEARNRLKEISR